MVEAQRILRQMAEASRQHATILSLESHTLAAALTTASETARQRCDIATRPARYALAAAFNCCNLLRTSLPRGQNDNILDQDSSREAWLGLAAALFCGTGSLLVSGVCAWLTLIELCACAGKSVAASLATTLAAGANFGSAMPDIRVKYDEWTTEQLHARAEWFAQQQELEQAEQQQMEQQLQQQQVVQRGSTGQPAELDENDERCSGHENEDLQRAGESERKDEDRTE
mmetsp:Transcript_33920/g.89245  ORF Transcript_33920/g.89245 Transcript_33920/m.89245 type:complete len:229 (+) Transcript_33920:1-687(+)